MSQNLIISCIVGILFLLIVGVFVYFFVQIRQLKLMSTAVNDSLVSIENKLMQIDDELHEIHSGSQALGRKVKELVETVSHLSDRQQRLAEQDPQSRFYLKATKLIANGSSIEEVIRECELPRAEVELLFNLHLP